MKTRSAFPKFESYAGHSGLYPSTVMPRAGGAPSNLRRGGGSRWADQRVDHPHDRWLLGRPPEAGDDGSECGAVGGSIRSTAIRSNSRNRRLRIFSVSPVSGIATKKITKAV